VCWVPAATVRQLERDGADNVPPSSQNSDSAEKCTAFLRGVLRTHRQERGGPWSLHGQHNLTPPRLSMLYHISKATWAVYKNKLRYKSFTMSFVPKFVILIYLQVITRSSWLHIHRSGFDSRRYQIFRAVVDLELGPLSLISTTEEIYGKKSSGSGL
jgi:hypothetical protein